MTFAVNPFRVRYALSNGGPTVGASTTSLGTINNKQSNIQIFIG